MIAVAMTTRKINSEVVAGALATRRWENRHAQMRQQGRRGTGACRIVHGRHLPEVEPRDQQRQRYGLSMPRLRGFSLLSGRGQATAWVGGRIPGPQSDPGRANAIRRDVL